MTREEAVLYWERLRKTFSENVEKFENKIVKQYYRTSIEAIDAALTALRGLMREQVEKGEWIDAYEDFSTAKCSKCGELYDVSDTGENLKVLFEGFQEYYRFCPSCGSPMTDKAVEMLCKKLEGIQ